MLLHLIHLSVDLSIHKIKHSACIDSDKMHVQCFVSLHFITYSYMNNNYKIGIIQVELLVSQIFDDLLK